MSADAYAHLSPGELAALDAILREQENDKWQTFYADRAKPCPFFGLAPDENLHRWIHDGAIAARGLALDIGCGNARNAIFLARQGFSHVDAVDLSESATAWAEEEVAKAQVPVSVRCASIFDLGLQRGRYDLVYDAGCFHQIAPHRRMHYVRLISDAVRPGGTFGLVCFRPDGGSGLSDEDVYEQRSLRGGLGYDEARLRAFWSALFDIVELVHMNEEAPGTPLFGKDFLWAMRAIRRA